MGTIMALSSASIITLLTKAYGIALGFLGISFLVAIHELGHFFCCKFFGVHTPSFSLGFGPKLYSKKIGDTVFSLSALPLGGYVEIAGVEEVGQGNQNFAKDQSATSFSTKPYYQKVIILLGGIIVNMSFAWIALTLLFSFKGIPAHQAFASEVSTTRIESVMEKSLAETVGLQPGDTIVSVNQIPFKTGIALSTYLQQKAGQNVTLEVASKSAEGSKTRTVEALLNAPINTPQLGVKFELTSTRPLSFVQSAQTSVTIIHHWIASTFNSLISLIQKRTTQGLGGPVAVIHSITKSANSGFVFFLISLCFISVGIACLNLLPLPIFDGGQVLFYTIEAISGRSLESIRLWIHYISWLLVVGLIIWLTWYDILRVLGL
jgi:regulator of sigma E protease